MRRGIVWVLSVGALRIEPRLKVGRSSVTVELRVQEYPSVREVVVRGLTEVDESQIVADLLGSTAEDAPGSTWSVGIRGSSACTCCWRRGAPMAVWSYYRPDNTKPSQRFRALERWRKSACS
jgi:hypothetical protein